MLARAMNARLKKLGKEEKGFTLIELLAVIVIIGIIAIIAIPLISNILSKTKTDADVATARQIYDAARLYVIGEKNGEFKGEQVIIANTTTDTLVGKGYLEKGISLPSTKNKITGGFVQFDSTGALAESVAVSITTDATTDSTKTFTADEIQKAKATGTTTTTTTTPK